MSAEWPQKICENLAIRPCRNPAVEYTRPSWMPFDHSEHVLRLQLICTLLDFRIAL